MESDEISNAELFTLLEVPHVELFKARGLVSKLERREVDMDAGEKHRLDKLRHKTKRELDIALRADS